MEEVCVTVSWLIKWPGELKDMTELNKMMNQVKNSEIRGGGGCSYDGHCRLTWSLTSGPVGLVEVRASWPGHPH
jgi:hypothetical protein